MENYYCITAKMTALANTVSEECGQKSQALLLQSCFFFSLSLELRTTSRDREVGGERGDG